MIFPSRLLKEIEKKTEDWKELNYEQSLYVQSLITHMRLLSRKKMAQQKDQLVSSIDAHLKCMYNKSYEGHWKQADGEKMFVYFLETLKQRILLRKRIPKRLSQLIETKFRAKIKTVFFINETSLWPAVQSVYKAMRDDGRFDTALVYVPFNHAYTGKDVDYFSIYREQLHLPVIHCTEYDLSKKQPDIAIYIKPYDLIPVEFRLDDVSIIVPNTVYIPYAFFDIPTENSILYGYQLPFHNNVWKIIAYSQNHYDTLCTYNEQKGENAVLIGHPKFDVSLRPPDNNNDIVKRYSSIIKDRPVLLWNTHFVFTSDENFSGTYLDYGKTVIEYFENNLNIVLLWRPHPLFFAALQKNGIMSADEIHAFKQKLNNMDNIILDEESDYLTAFSMSDALLTDGGSSIAFEYTATGKPVYYLVKNDGYKMPENSIAKYWYWIHSAQEFYQYLDDFLHGKDPMKMLRSEKNVYMHGPIDGHNGEHIRDYLWENLSSKDEIFNMEV